MKRTIVATILVLAVLAAAYVSYVERTRLIAWYRSLTEEGSVEGLYYCPMHPSFTSGRPGNCAICGMSLVKKEAANAPTDGQKARTRSAVYISPQKQQLIGVKKDKVQVRRLSGQILTVGRVAYDPALFTAQQEYLQILKGRQSTANANLSDADEQSASLLTAARSKLVLMGMSHAEIDAMEKRGKAETNLYLPTAEDGEVWVYVAIYEYEAALVKEGLPVQVDAPAYPGQTFHGRIVSVAPVLEAATRTLKVRALVENPEGKLKLEMFANVRIDYDVGEKPAVPEDAVMHAGTRKIVFVVDPNDHFTPRTVVLGTKAQGYYEVLRGLSADEAVVVSGNFLVDSESKLSAVLNQMGEPNSQNGGHRHD